MSNKHLVTLERLKELLAYDPATGIFTWKIRRRNQIRPGTIAGKSVNDEGYHKIFIDAKSYSAHRLAWFYMTGLWPNFVDHINGIKTDNRFANLRDVSNSENQQNQRKAHKHNLSGFLGVSSKGIGQFSANIRLNGKQHYLGTYPTAEAAHAAYLNAKRELHQSAIHVCDELQQSVCARATAAEEKLANIRAALDKE